MTVDRRCENAGDRTASTEHVTIAHAPAATVYRYVDQATVAGPWCGAGAVNGKSIDIEQA